MLGHAKASERRELEALGEALRAQTASTADATATRRPAGRPGPRLPRKTWLSAAAQACPTGRHGRAAEGAPRQDCERNAGAVGGAQGRGFSDRGACGRGRLRRGSGGEEAGQEEAAPVERADEQRNDEAVPAEEDAGAGDSEEGQAEGESRQEREAPVEPAEEMSDGRQADAASAGPPGGREDGAIPAEAQIGATDSECAQAERMLWQEEAAPAEPTGEPPPETGAPPDGREADAAPLEHAEGRRVPTADSGGSQAPGGPVQSADAGWGDSDEAYAGGATPDLTGGTPRQGARPSAAGITVTVVGEPEADETPNGEGVRASSEPGVGALTPAPGGSQPAERRPWSRGEWGQRDCKVPGVG